MKKVTVILCLVCIAIFADTKSIYVSSAFYYDADADGFIDSITMSYSGPISESDLDELISLVVLPPWRNFTVTSVKLISEKIFCFIVVENRTLPVTSVNSDDLLSTVPGNLPGGGIVRQNSFMARDRVAPVIVSANLNSYHAQIDSLRIEFSEIVNNFNSNTPFNFRVPSGDSYQISFDEGALNGSVFIATISSTHAGIIKEGDSVWIDTEANISDPSGNVQANELNRRVPISVQLFDDYVSFSNAFYYDINADGFIDSIVIAIFGTLEEQDLNALAGMISLPSERSFTILQMEIVEEVLVIKVQENSVEPRTSVFNFDSIEITGGIVPGRILIKSAQLTVEDRVAPVLLSAHLDDHQIGDDTLFINFSEQVQTVPDGQPFRFIKAGANQYVVTLSGVTLSNSDAYSGHIESTSQAMEPGDLVWINTEQFITDMADNVQDNPQNRRVPLTVDGLDIPVTVKKAYYIDENADGFVDRIRIEYSGPVTGDDFVVFQSLMQLPKIRSFQVNGMRVEEGGLSEQNIISLLVTEGGRIPRTSIVNGDQIVFSSGRLINNGFLLPVTIDVRDSMAPVILSAHLDWYGMSNDTLRVAFSEAVKNVNTSIPFLFSKPGESIYNVTMQNNGTVQQFRYTGAVRDAEHSSGMQTHDSVWISTGASIADILGIIQGNGANRRVLLTVKNHFALRVVVENNPFCEGKRPLPLVVREAYAARGLNTPSDGLVIIAEPDRSLLQNLSMQGTVSIYDVVHNAIVKDEKMVFEERKNRLYYVWDGFNNSGRKTGSGTYLGVVKIIDQNGKTLTKMVNLGVKR